MSELVQQKLCEMVARYGRSLCDDPRRCRAILSDFCGQHRKEINILVEGIAERVPADLLGSRDGTPFEILELRLARRLRDDLAFDMKLARWAVRAWACALGILPSHRGNATAEVILRSPGERFGEAANPRRHVEIDGIRRDAAEPAAPAEELTAAINARARKDGVVSHLPSRPHHRTRMSRLAPNRPQRGHPGTTVCSVPPAISQTDLQPALTARTIVLFLGIMLLPAMGFLGWTTRNENDYAEQRAILAGVEGLCRQGDQLLLEKKYDEAQAAFGSALQKAGSLKKQDEIAVERARRGARGLIPFGGRWITTEEMRKVDHERFVAAQRAKGLVEYKGAWMTPDEKLAAEMLDKGFVLSGQRWISLEELRKIDAERYASAQRARGLVEYEGEWLSAEEAEFRRTHGGLDLPAWMRASVQEKYANLVQVLQAPDDERSYGSFNDYGSYSYIWLDEYKGQKVPNAHYWVYVAPRWYIWNEKTR